jgi:hypothetical protein
MWRKIESIKFKKNNFEFSAGRPTFTAVINLKSGKTVEVDLDTNMVLNGDKWIPSMLLAKHCILLEEIDKKYYRGWLEQQEIEL